MLTPTAYIILGLLERLGSASPYDLKQAAAATVGNFWTTPHSQIYRTAQLLEESGHVTLEAQRTPGGRPRKVYTATEPGREALDLWRRTPLDLRAELRDPGLLQLHFGADVTVIAPGQLARHRRQLQEYRERAALDPGDGPRGIWLTLAAGIAHEEEWVRFWEALVRHP